MIDAKNAREIAISKQLEENTIQLQDICKSIEFSAECGGVILYYNKSLNENTKAVLLSKGYKIDEYSDPREAINYTIRW